MVSHCGMWDVGCVLGVRVGVWSGVVCAVVVVWKWSGVGCGAVCHSVEWVHNRAYAKRPMQLLYIDAWERLFPDPLYIEKVVIPINAKPEHKSKLRSEVINKCVTPRKYSSYRITP